MSKGMYRSVDVKDVDENRLWEAVEGRRVVVGVDVGKFVCRASVTTGSKQVHKIIGWKSVPEGPALVDLLLGLPASSLEVVLEPTSTYGDSLAHQLLRRGVPVFQVGPNRVHAAGEVYDGVPSTHDAKAACVIARLHWDGGTNPWRVREGTERELSARVRVLAYYEQEDQRLLQKLEALLARHWPEVTEILKLTSRTLPEILACFGGPGGVAANPEAARKLMHEISRRRLAPEKIVAILETAGKTQGTPMILAEQETIATFAREMLRCRDEARKIQDRVEASAEEHEAAGSMASTIGTKTSGVLVAECGDPRSYPHAHAYEKALGLNLKERSSGKYQGQLKITKRGSGVARRYLFLAVLRLIQKDAVVRAWYERKVAKYGGRLKVKAIVAVMRKLARALWHLARGEAFDSTKLFDTRKLGLT